MYNIEATIRAFKNLAESELGEEIGIVESADYYVIDNKHGAIMSDFDLDDHTGHRKYVDLYVTNEGAGSYKKIPHPMIFDLIFNLTLYSNKQVKLWEMQEETIRFFQKRRLLDVTVVAGDETGEFSHEMVVSSPFRGNFRANLSDLKQLQGSIKIKEIPVYAKGTAISGSLIAQVLLRIKEESLAGEDLGELDLIRVPAEPETEW